MTEKRPRFIAVEVRLQNNQQITIYASPRIAEAFQLIKQMDMFHGVEMLQLLGAVYRQGKRDGARETLDRLGDHIIELKDEVPHRIPGRPRKLPR